MICMYTCVYVIIIYICIVCCTDPGVKYVRVQREEYGPDSDNKRKKRDRTLQIVVYVVYALGNHTTPSIRSNHLV